MGNSGENKNNPGASSDNRGESARRYGNLEPEGYERHHHGNREGEYQQGGKAPVDLPVEESAPMKNTRYRKSTKEKTEEPQYGGTTRDSNPGDKDVKH